MSDTPWTDARQLKQAIISYESMGIPLALDSGYIRSNDVREIERSHQRLLEALKSLEGEAKLAIATRAIQRPCAGLMGALDSSAEAIKQAIC